MCVRITNGIINNMRHERSIKEWGFDMENGDQR